MKFENKMIFKSKEDPKDFGIFNVKYETPANRYQQRDKERRFMLSPLETKTDPRLNLSCKELSKSQMQKTNSNYIKTHNRFMFGSPQFKNNNNFNKSRSRIKASHSDLNETNLGNSFMIQTSYQK